MATEAPDTMVRDLLRNIPAGERRALAEVLARRFAPMVHRVIEQAPADAIKEALASPTDVGAFARILTSAAGEPDVQSLDPLAEAFARGAERQREMLDEVGGAWSAQRVATHLKVTRQAVDKRRKRGTLLAVESAAGHLFPAGQFTEAGVLNGLPEVLRAIDSENGWTRLSVLLSGTLRGREQTVLDAIRGGDLEDALHAARAWGTHGAT